MSEPVSMTRAELRVWALELEGWTQLRWFPQPPLLTCVNPGERVPRDRSTPMPAALIGTNPDGVECLSPPDPTREIGAAWALKEGFVAHATDTQLKRFSWQEADEPILEKTAEQAVTWICCAVHFAVTGNRVVITE